MFSAEATILAGRGARKIVLQNGQEIMTVRAVMDAWRKDDDFVAFFAEQLGEAPYPAFRWETPAVTERHLDRPFEMVLVESLALAKANASAAAFAAPLGRARTEGHLAACFANLGGDAQLIAPVGEDGEPCCAHLAAFCRKAAMDRQVAFWKAVGAAMRKHVRSEPVWLSTAGHGVPWLHVRLDSRPKYYAHGPYRSPL